MSESVADRTGPAGSEAAARTASLPAGLALAALVGVACGLASALFLWSLDLATSTRTAHRWLPWLLPVAGLFLAALLFRFGTPVRGGTNLLFFARIRDGGPRVPLRMAPIVLVGTLWTHLFGGSAGREGTAVQMGGSLADAIAHRFGVDETLRRKLVSAGVAGGFGSVFGTPFAGTFFALEFVRRDRLDLRALPFAAIAAFVGDRVTHLFGIAHTPYPSVAAPGITFSLVLGLAALAVAVGVAVVAFIELAHAVRRTGERLLPSIALRMAAGGAVVVTLWQLSRTDDYLGLGVPTIVRAFSDPALDPFAFAWKLVMTAVTVGSGFLGGEVTPLFFIGATLGNALASPLGLPLDLAAGLGLAATFGAAANAPVALAVMCAELLGPGVIHLALAVSLVASLVKGRRSIYPGQLAPPPPDGARP